MTLQEIVKEIKQLSAEERKTLITMITETLAEPKTHTLRELRGVGKHLWGKMDAQEYVNRLRDERDSRP